MNNAYEVAQLDEIEPSECPCGHARRAFTNVEGAPATVHLLDVSKDARTHYHRTLTEVYLVLEGNGVLHLDEDVVDLRPMTAVMIPPGTRHRAEGELRVLNLVVPPFDPDDEWFD